SKSEWLIHQGNAQKISVTHAVYANDLSVRTAYCDHEIAFANLPAVVMHPRGFLNAAVSLRIRTPAQWDLALAKTPKSGLYRFADFDELYDTPVLCAAELTRREFRVSATKFRIAACGPARLDFDKLARDLSKIIAKQIAIFGDHPCDTYLFQILF